jgi:hypothetical protein
MPLQNDGKDNSKPTPLVPGNENKNQQNEKSNEDDQYSYY